MIVTPLGSRRTGDYTVLESEVIWEREPGRRNRIYVGVPREFDHLLSDTADWALLACLPHASVNRERISIEASVDALMLESIPVLQRYYQVWSGLDPVEIRARGPLDRPPSTSGTTALFMSGGVDSL